MNIKKILISGIAIALFTSAVSLNFNNITSKADSQTIDLQILATSDYHGKILPYDYCKNKINTKGSMAQAATAIKELRTDNTILIDAGDSFQDNLSEKFINDKPNPMILAFNKMKYDFLIPGNHDFDHGVDTLQELMSQATAKFLCGNVSDKNNKTIGDSYSIIEKNGVKIGVIGMVTPSITRWDEKQLNGYNVTNPTTETKAIIKKIKDDVDVLIAVEHMKLENEFNVPGSGIKDLANKCPELDLIIAAHGHKLVATKINGIPVVENPKGGSTIAQVNMQLSQSSDSWTINNCSTNTIELSQYNADEELTNILAPYDKRAKEYATTHTKPKK